jgi:hypothetical protein
LRELHFSKHGTFDNAPKIETTTAEFPNFKDRMLDGINMPVLFGGFYMILAPLSVFSTLLPQMVKEKTENLRIGLHVFGVSSSAHWLSWTITGAAYSFVSCLATPLVAQIAGFEMF